jgi:hypothetical protein
VSTARIEYPDVVALRITSGTLDPIDVYVRDIKPGVGSVTIACWADAWFAYWGGIGDRSMAQFFVETDVDYLVGCMLGTMTVRPTRRERKYLGGIIAEVQAALRVHLDPERAPSPSVADYRLAFAEIRDSIVSGRFQFAEMEVDSDIINAVLGIIDDNDPGLAEGGES